MLNRRLRAAVVIGALVGMPVWFTAVALAAEQSPPPSPSASSAALTGNPTKGQQLYSTTCTSCHGANMEGTTIGPRLNPIQNLGNTKDPLDAAYLERVITDGLSGVGPFGTAMPAKGGNTSLTDRDVKDLAAYIIQQNHTAGSAALDPITLARSNVFWVTVTIFLMVMVTWLLARYNMRWIARRAAQRRSREHTP